MPADPRGGPIGVNAASFAREGDQLSYRILIMQDEPVKQAFKGKVEMAVEGRHASGRYETIDLDPIDIDLQRYQHLAGNAALPEGFRPARVTVRVTDAETGKQRAMRILIVRNS